MPRANKIAEFTLALVGYGEFSMNANPKIELGDNKKEKKATGDNRPQKILIYGLFDHKFAREQKL